MCVTVAPLDGRFTARNPFLTTATAGSVKVLDGTPELTVTFVAVKSSYRVPWRYF